MNKLKPDPLCYSKHHQTTSWGISRSAHVTVSLRQAVLFSAFQRLYMMSTVSTGTRKAGAWSEGGEARPPPGSSTFL